LQISAVHTITGASKFTLCLWHINVILSDCRSIMLHALDKCVSQIDGSLLDDSK